MKRNTIKMLTATIITALSIQPATNCIWPFTKAKPKPKTICVVKDAVVNYGSKYGSQALKYGQKAVSFVGQNKLATGAITVGAAGTIWAARKLKNAIFKKEDSKNNEYENVCANYYENMYNKKNGLWKNHKGKIITGGALVGLTTGYFLAPKKYVALGALGLAALNTYGAPILDKFSKVTKVVKDFDYWGKLINPLKWFSGTAQTDENKKKKTEQEQINADFKKKTKEVEEKKKKAAQDTTNKKNSNKNDATKPKLVKEDNKKTIDKPVAKKETISKNLPPKTKNITRETNRPATQPIYSKNGNYLSCPNNGRCGTKTTMSRKKRAKYWQR